MKPQLTRAVHGKVPDEVGDEAGRHPWFRVLLIFGCIKQSLIVQDSRHVESTGRIVESMIVVDRHIRSVPSVGVVERDRPR